MATVSTFVGDGKQRLTDGVGTTASFCFPTGISIDNEGTMFVAEWGNHSIRKITGDGVVTTFAGTGDGGFTDGAGDQAQFYYPFGVCVTDAGVVVVADMHNHRIRRITPDGNVSTLAGNGTEGYQDGDGVGTMFNHPRDVVMDGDGNVLVADTDNHRIRKISADGRVTTLAGNGVGGHRDGDGTQAQFNTPSGLCVDSEGVMYVADSNNRIRRITHDGQVSTVAGNGQRGHQDGNGTAACFNSPTGIAVDGTGSLFVADYNNHRIRKIAVDGQVTTVAGTGQHGFQDGDGSQALFHNPRSLAIDDEGSIFVTDESNNCIRKITGAAAPRATATTVNLPPLTGTFADRTRACNRVIATAERHRVTVLTTHAAAVVTAHAKVRRCETELVDAQTELVQTQQEEREADTASLAAITNARDALAELIADMAAFRVKVTADLAALNTNETREVLLMLDVTTATLEMLQKEKVDGSVLSDVSEEDMLRVFNMVRFGDRRRLTNAVRRLVNHQGFSETLQGHLGR